MNNRNSRVNMMKQYAVYYKNKKVSLLSQIAMNWIDLIRAKNKNKNGGGEGVKCGDVWKTS